MPFGCGLSFPVSQAHDTGSHTYNDVWAWDFKMPEGTPVVAAMEGVVRMTRGDSTVGGCDIRFAPMSNYVVVSHAGGLETQYLHFRDVVVKPGDSVRAGQLLGHSGKTGWACGAHLHFKLAQQTSEGWNNPSIPAHVAGHGDPQAKSWVTAPACVQMPQMASRESLGSPGKAAQPHADANAPAAAAAVKPPAVKPDGVGGGALNKEAPAAAASPAPKA